MYSGAAAGWVGLSANCNERAASEAAAGRNASAGARAQRDSDDTGGWKLRRDGVQLHHGGHGKTGDGSMLQTEMNCRADRESGVNKGVHLSRYPPV